MSRIGIFQMSDPDGIVDNYIVYLLKEVIQNVSDLVIVINGNLRKEEEDKLKQFTEEIYYRCNKGYDAEAYKEAILEFIGVDRIREYDELLLCNDTFFGPFYPLEIVFREMAESSVDFWGLTKHGEYQVTGGEYGHEHIQSYFLVIRHSILSQDVFAEFWETMQPITSFTQLVIQFEIRFSEFFSSRGFLYEAYVKDDIFNVAMEDNFNHYMLIPYTLIKKYKMPVLKKKTFIESRNLAFTAGEELRKAMHYIEEETSYDTAMIWQNIIRRYNVRDIKNALALNYVLPYQQKIMPDFHTDKKVAVIAHLVYDEMVDDCLEYLQLVPKEFDVYITTYKKCIQEKVNNTSTEDRPLRCIMVKNRGRDSSALVVGCRDIILKYDYLCYVHDKKTSGGKGFYTIGASFKDIIWENTLKSADYIYNVLATLEENSFLGFLSPPEPIHAGYLPLHGKEWTCCFEKTKRLLEKMNIDCNLSLKKPPFTLSSTFWCKVDAIKKIFEYSFTYEDFPEEPIRIDGELNHCIERIFSYVAQDAGYYSGIMESTDYAAVDIENLNRRIEEKVCDDNTEMKKMIRFANNYDRIFLYGAGEEAKKISDILNEADCKIEAFVVSDDHYGKNNFLLKPVIPLRDMPNEKNCGVIVALNVVNTLAVYMNLEKRKNCNIFYIYDPIEYEIVNGEEK